MTKVLPMQPTLPLRRSYMHEEYVQLETQYYGSNFPSTFNSHKNRYKGVLPVEETRVKLNLIEGREETDYINANYITDENTKTYIACQAPLESTTEDFWRMIWEQRCGVIVMLTPLLERGIIKANCYWPEEENKVNRYGNLLVCHKKSFTVGDITVRSIFIKDSTSHDKKDMREIVQLHYENWPDFGVPASTKPIRDLLVLMTKFRERATAATLDGPIVVHCSAGVGRTGCLIASHIAIEKAKRREEFNIKKIVEQLRRERHPTMVKTEDQYILVYAVVKDVLTKSSVL